MLAGQLGKMPNRMLIEGHTSSQAFAASVGGYSNWELSADRANSARKLMQESGLSKDAQVAEVRGYADQHLRKPEAQRALPTGGCRSW